MTKYHTTMNLPAPKGADFQKHVLTKWRRPEIAHRDFEAALREFFNVPAVLTFSNCFIAIAVALISATINRQKTVVVAALGYRRTLDILKWAGLNPLFVDNDLTTLGMDLIALEDLLKKKRVGCILYQHPMVKIDDVEKLQKLSKKFDTPIIFDSVEATGSEIPSGKIGNFGICEAFSLHPSKVLNAAEGGVLTFGSKKKFISAKILMKSAGFNFDHTTSRLFSLEPLHAILGIESLRIYDKITEKHKSQYEEYFEHLYSSERFSVVEYDPQKKPNYKSLLVKLREGFHKERSNLIKYLEKHNVGARPYYFPMYPSINNSDYRNAEKISQRYLILPMGHSVEKADIAWICNKMRNY